MLVKNTHLGPEGVCLAGLRTALANLARAGAHLDDAVAKLRQRDTYVANHLLQVVYTAGADRYADEAAEMLSAEPWRFMCGYSDSNYWTSMELVRAIAPHCTTAVRARLEAAMLTYTPPWERSKEGYKAAGFASFSLLSALPSELRSSGARARYAELERKFREPAKAPRGVWGGSVRSPIEKHAAEKMTDAHWLGAIEKYSPGRRDRSRDDLKGGAWELSLTLQSFVTQQPERFARLALRFPSDANPIYLDRTLVGLKKSTIPAELKLEICRKAFAEAREACGQSIADLLGESEDMLPDEMIGMLISLATDHPDPDHEAWQTAAGSGDTYYNGDVYMNGINTTRGRGAEAIRQLIWRDAAYLPHFRDSLERMVQDASTCVRSCVVGTLDAVACHDAPLALALFGRMHIDDDRLLATPRVYEFIRSLLHDHFDTLRPTIERMLRSDDDDVAQCGARLTGLAALHHSEAADLDREAAKGSAPQRRGLGEVAAANIAAEECRAWCEQHLSEFFDDQDAEVRKDAAGSFRQLREKSLESYEPLILAFVNSVSYREDSLSILHCLERSLQRLPGITCVVCGKFLDRFSGEARDIRTSRMHDASIVTQLAFRTYHHHQNDEWTSRALDLIDRLCLEGIGDAQKELDVFER